MDTPECGHMELWLARDGWWRCVVCNPPCFAGEVVDRGTHEQQEELFDQGDYDAGWRRRPRVA